MKRDNALTCQTVSLHFVSAGNVAESGRIPQGILSMTALTQLRLDDSIFTSIGDVSVLSNLKYLDMSTYS